MIIQFKKVKVILKKALSQYNDPKPSKIRFT